MLNLLYIKTLPHLIPAHVAYHQPLIYAERYNKSIEQYIKDIKIIGENTPYQQAIKIITAQPYPAQTQGDTIKLSPPGYAHPVKIEYFDTHLEKITLIDSEYGYKLQELPQAITSNHQLQEKTDQAAITVNLNAENPKQNAIIFSQQTIEQADADNYDFSYPGLFWGKLDLFAQELARLKELGYHIHIFTKHQQELKKLIDSYATSSDTQLQKLGLDYQALRNASAGLISSTHKVAVFTDREIFGTIYLAQRKAADSSTEKLLRQFEGEISVGDYLVHQDYGVCLYAGLTQETISGELREFMQLKYAGDSELLLPLEQVDKLTKYIGQEGLEPKLSKLGKGDWQQTTKKVKRSVQILAKELLEHYARRELTAAQTIDLQDSQKYSQFLATFPHAETTDQLKATAEILQDMSTPEPMNRLLVGDVGFGKTEVMLRAVHKAVEAGMQVAVLCPTTVLAAQHAVVFEKRLNQNRGAEGGSFRITSLSRFNTASENRRLVDQINAGNYDVIIGTHRLLSKDLKFRNLGLLVVDEEQCFGVKQKERIRQLNYGVHYLSVSATPIPRTLSMALSSIQSLSVITQPPKGRQAIQTELSKLNWDKVTQAIHHEVERGGQVYFVHNEVQTLQAIYTRLQKLLPNIKVVIAHGQMSSRDLDKAITDFYTAKYDVLLCTTIIENGLDMPNVNTMIINNAQRFGLAQLYQLRGRVGRSARKAFCYLFYSGTDLPTAGDGAETEKEKVAAYLDRLQALVDASEIGAGFQVASRDLEIRGAGNVLGEKQHGHISVVGYALYIEMLAKEINRLRALQRELGTREYLSL